jgi:cytochrome oxidase Cu insertion factor (SCO1/SenC/PrrC family)
MLVRWCRRRKNASASAVVLRGVEANPVIAQQRGADVRAKTGFHLPHPTLLAGLIALLVGVGGTFAVNSVLSHAPATARAASAVYLPPVNRAPQPAPDFRLRDQAGQLMSLSGLRGREVLVTFMDPKCTTLCPIMGQELGSVEAGLPASVTPVLLIVSVAPDRTAADVGTFVSHVTWRPGWHWLLGNQAELQAVWATWSISVDGADIQHDESLFVVDPQGKMVASYNAPLGITEVASTITKHSTR